MLLGTILCRQGTQNALQRVFCVWKRVVAPQCILTSHSPEELYGDIDFRLVQLPAC